jgi:ATP-dependent RNA helicase HrpB
LTILRAGSFLTAPVPHRTGGVTLAGLDPLPIDDVLPSVIAALRAHRRLVLEAPPGAGKTTRVPPAIEAAGLSGPAEVVVLEPRRLAARLAATRVAAEASEPVGGRIGYQVRFDQSVGPRTRIRYVTEGILSRRLVSEPTLPGVGAVVMDEFHERHLVSDVVLARLAQF